MLDVVSRPGEVAVVVVAMAGCPACEEYEPRFRRFVPYYRSLRFVHIDALDQRPAAQEWMDRYQVSATPSTLVVRRTASDRPELRYEVWKIDGSVDDATIKQTLDFAYSLTFR